MYDFRRMCAAIRSIADSVNSTGSADASPDGKRQLKDELNIFFGKKIVCTEVVVTCNTDKPMFGAIVVPALDNCNGLITDTMLGNIDPRLTTTSYAIDIDSKLFGILPPIEICAILINDINEMLSERTITAVIDAFNAIIAYQDTVINRALMTHTTHILRIAVAITMHNLSSSVVMGNTEDGEYGNHISYALLKECGVYEDFVSGLTTLKSNSTYRTELTIYNPTVLLNWYVAHYMDVNYQDIAGTIKEAISLESSVLVRRMLVSCLNYVSMVPSDAERYYASVTEAASKQKKGLIGQMKRNGLKSLEEDLYEYSMRLRNVDTQDDALLLMRQLNSRISILDDYLAYEELSDSERRRWQKTYDEYIKIRDALTNKTVYNRKMYGLFVDYNALADMSRSQQQQILQSYY